MKNLLRRLTLGTVILLLVAGLPRARAAGETDDELVNAMNAQLRDLQQKILATDDLTARAKYQKEMMQAMDQTMAKMSPKGRALMLVGMKVLQPLQQAGATYNQMVTEFISSDNSKFTTIKLREEIKPRLEQIARLAAANDSLIVRFTNFEADAARMLDDAKIEAADKRDFLSGLQESLGKQMGPVTAIRNLDSKLYVQWKAALEHLDLHWGAWSVTEQNTFAWTDKEAETKFNDIMQLIETLAERQKQAEQALAART